MPKFLKRACAELGLEIVTPFDLKIDEENTVQFDVLLPQLGFKRGMLITGDASLLSEKLVDLGYGYTCYDVYSELGGYDLAGHKEMFSDWGWASQESDKPDWMT